MDESERIRKSFAHEITRNVAILPRNWSMEGSQSKDRPTQEMFNTSFESACADARKRWAKGPDAALEPLIRLYRELNRHPCFPNQTELMAYAAAFYLEAGPTTRGAGFERWHRAVDAGILDFCEEVLSTDDVLSQIYAVLDFFLL